MSFPTAYDKYLYKKWCEGKLSPQEQAIVKSWSPAKFFLFPPPWLQHDENKKDGEK